MADVRLNIASREYIVTCQDGEEERLKSLGMLVDEMAREAVGSAGGLNESRQLLFASLLLADKLQDSLAQAQSAAAPPTSAPVHNDLAVEQAAMTIEKMAERLETIANRLEN
ncbi:cell division protein ZapA [Sphingorhabdus arenilitoris]|uniref:Cell division protein ZapA n=1 Tax=Sphingorhabdus arenilitoris TaxID=1490041 RepID=A0ABV8RFW7_9SPHN